MPEVPNWFNLLDFSLSWLFSANVFDILCVYRLYCGHVGGNQGKVTT